MDDVSPGTSEHKAKRQTMPGAINWLLRLYITLMIPFLLVVGSARLIMTPDFLGFEYNRPNFPADTYGFSVYDRFNYGPYGVLYIVNNEPIEYLSELELPGELCYPPDERPCPAFNSLELSHMEDVQVVAQGLFRAALWGGLIAVIIGFILIWWAGLYSLRLALMQGSILTIGLILAIALLAVSAWDAFFGGFHSLFFAEGTWQFYYSDTLIRLYPEQFWFDASITAGVLAIVGAGVILAISFALRSLKA